MALSSSFHAANHTPWDHRYLAQFDPAYYGRLRFSLAPACVLFSSLYPVHQIWQANQSGADGSVTLMQQETYLLILRNVEGIEFIPLTPGEYRFLVALRTGQILSDAILQALSIDLAFDPSQVLAQQIARGVLIDVRQDVAYSL